MEGWEDNGSVFTIWWGVLSCQRSLWGLGRQGGMPPCCFWNDTNNRKDDSFTEHQLLHNSIDIYLDRLQLYFWWAAGFTCSLPLCPIFHLNTGSIKNVKSRVKCTLHSCSSGDKPFPFWTLGDIFLSPNSSQNVIKFSQNLTGWTRWNFLLIHVPQRINPFPS